MPGQLLARVAGAWVPVSPGQALPVSPLIIPDPVGAVYPQLVFPAGDGNVTTPSSKTYRIDLYNNLLRFVDENLNQVMGSFKGLSSGVHEFSVGEWVLQSTFADGYLRIFFGADRTASELYFSQVGDLGCRNIAATDVAASGTLSGAYITTPGNVAASAITASSALHANGVYSDSAYFYGAGGNAILTGNGAGYAGLYGASDTAGVTSGNAYGAGNFPKVSIWSSNILGGDWQYRPLSIHKAGGAGEVGLAFVNHSSGVTASFQAFSDGSVYIGSLNGANSGYVKHYASAFTVQSSRKFKADIEPMSTHMKKPKKARAQEATTATEAIEQVVPVHYRDLQHEMALAPECLAPALDEEGNPLPEARAVEPIVPEYRFGLIAEDVRAAVPEATKETVHGPALDLSGMVAVLWQAVRELSARVTELEAAKA